MEKAAFTICAKNYIGLAQVLGESIKRFNPEVEFYIFVSDIILPEEIDWELPENIIIAKNAVDIPEEEWLSMAFKYDLTEFATSIKPACFQYIFKELKAEKCIYFDPDILIFSALDDLYNTLNQKSIILTPHITAIEDIYTGDLNEQNLLYSGIYNLGFIALNNDVPANKLLSWWKIRLKDRCFQNKMENYFTDQKWMDFIPAFFPKELLVSADIGLNLAPWNFYEREIVLRQNKLMVKYRVEQESDVLYPLTFVHFSGFDYKALFQDQIVQKNIANMPIPDDLKLLFQNYSDQLKQSTYSKYIGLEYSYASFTNGIPISNIYRKLFRRLLDDGKIVSDPFLSDGAFYLALKKSGLVNNSLSSSDKIGIANVNNAENKTLMINKILNAFYKIIGPERFFLMTRLMRLYSKPENHVYLIDKSYLKEFKIWN